MWWPLGLIILSNIAYNICTKAFPENINPFAALTFTYISAAVISIFLSNTTHIWQSFNIPSIILGIAIIGLEAGYVYLFRAGWAISKGSLIANTSLAIILIFIGHFFYHEHISLRQIAGVVLCLLGLYLVA